METGGRTALTRYRLKTSSLGLDVSTGPLVDLIHAGRPDRENSSSFSWRRFRLFAWFDSSVSEESKLHVSNDFNTRSSHALNVKH